MKFGRLYSCLFLTVYAAGSLLYGPLKILRQYTIVPCNHDQSVLPFNCLRKMAVATKRGNAKYFIATQASSVVAYMCVLQLICAMLIFYLGLSFETTTAGLCPVVCAEACQCASVASID